jgi:uncharacterized protein
MRHSLFGLFVAVGLALAAPGAAQTLPKPSGAVNDFANVLGPDSRAALAALIERLERDTSAEVAVLTVPSLDGLTVEDYATKVFNDWGVGRKDTDNGVLILVAPNERAIRIEVGYGLEGILPDGLAGAIIREEFVPRFRDGNIDGGIVQGVTRVADIVRRNETVTPEQLAALAKAAEGPDILPWILVPFMGLFVAIGSFMLGVGFKTRSQFEKIFGAGFGGVPLLLATGFVPWSFFVLGSLALFLFAFAYLRGYKWLESGSASAGSSASDRSWRSSTSPATSSSSSSSWSSSSSSSSFGGGSSGGGGASGKW